MGNHPSDVDRLWDLAGAVCNKSASDGELAELYSLLATDRAARYRYADYCRVHAALRLELRAHRATQEVNRQIDSELNVPAGNEFAGGTNGIQSTIPSGFPAAALGVPAGWLSSGWPVAYLAATVILGVGLVIGAVTHVSQPEQFVRQHLPSTFGRGAGGEGGRTADTAQSPVVGRITGMVDCQFAENSKTEDQRPKTTVSLGDKFALASGLMEITYDTGAKVILQGPVTYEVESPAGGFLSVGKLTARVDSAKPQAANPRSETSKPQSLIPNPLFSVRTPTATVTDLGTEFGVEVARSGETTSHVFRGSIRVQRAGADGTVEADGRILRENQTVRVESSARHRQIVTLQAFTPSHFVREIPTRTIKVFDLVDVVAGGDGYSGRRSGGIHPLTGEVVKAPKAEYATLVDNGQYHRVRALPLVDGVFSPGSGPGPVQVDSAGHLFEDFFTSENFAGGCVLAAGVMPMLPPSPDISVMPAVLDGVDYSSPGHGWIFMHANKGITFDMAAIRQANPAYRLARFRAVAGDMGPESALADVIVLVDGKLRFRRRQISRTTGAMPVNMPIAANDRFLTLVATDGGDGIQNDWILFGDPRLVLLPQQTDAGRGAAEP